MMFLHRMRIRDFQKHEELKIKFDPKMTAIVGPSDSGKSSIIRAIRWVAVNRPLGRGFIKNGGEEASVKLWLDNDSTVTRTKGSENIYDVNGLEFKAVGSEVPDLVESTLRLDDVNFQGQHDPPFWFSLSAGDVARELNAITDLSSIDRLMGKLSKEVRTKSQEVDINERKLSDLENEFDGVIHARVMDEELHEIEDVYKRASQLKEEIDRIDADVDFLGRTGRQLDQLSQKIDNGEAIKSSIQYWRSQCKTINEVKALVESAESIQRIIDLDIPDISDLSGMMEGCRSARKDLDELKALSKSYANYQSQRDVNKKRGSTAVDQLRKEFKTCPTCGQALEIKSGD